MLKRMFALTLIASMLFSLIPNGMMDRAQAEQQMQAVSNPNIWADVPDPSIIRVDDVYYMSSTTMHMNPGVPIMKSTDLVNWEIVNYVYDVLGVKDEQALRNGKNEYGQGSWASSLRYHEGTYYVAFSSYSVGKTLIYQTNDIENGTWERYELDGFFHDMSLLFDDDGRVYMIHGSHNIGITELTSDAKAIKQGGLEKVLIPEASFVASPNVGLGAEGAHFQKINGKYYVFLITWPPNKGRTQLVFRADTVDGVYEGRVALDDRGVAQGGLIDTVDGHWYAFLFRDNGSVGRIPYLVPVSWSEDQWPVFGIDGKIPNEILVPLKGASTDSYIVDSDEFYYNPASSFSTSSSSYVQNVLSGRQSISSSFVAGSSLALSNDFPISEEEVISGNELNALSMDEASTNLAKSELLANGGFENGLEPWTVYGAAEIQLSTEEAHGGEYSLYVAGRTATGDGPKQTITAPLKAGGQYEFSAKVKYTEGPDQKVFHYAIQHGSSWQGIKVIGNSTLTKGEWGIITGTYTVANDADLSEAFIFIETPWSGSPDSVNDLMDFYVDEVSFVKAEEGEPEAPSIDPNELLVNGGMEEGLEPWGANGSAGIELSTEEAHGGDHSLYVTGRVATGDGPKQAITAQIKPGDVYQFSANVLYTEGPERKVFNYAIQHGPTWQGIKVLGSSTLTKGEWGKITGTYTVQEDANLSETFIFIETPWAANPSVTDDLLNFYVDNISFIKQPVTIIPDQVMDGEYDDNGSKLPLVWQWNHTPDHRFWSLTDRPGYLRLTNGSKSTSIVDAKNTLTQRTFGPESSGYIAIDVSNMKDGDYTGLAAFQAKYGYVGVTRSGNEKYLIMVNNSSEEASVVERVLLEQDRVYLKVELDYKNNSDKAYFYYSLDGVNWTEIGNVLQMSYTLPHFMGYRFALFSYATKTTGGYVDFDYFRIGDKLTGVNEGSTKLNAELEDAVAIGVPNMELEIPIKLDALPSGNYTSLEASLQIPSALTVTGVQFNEHNVEGDVSYHVIGNQLLLNVTGSSISLSNGNSRELAKLKLKVKGLIPQDETVTLRADYINVAGGNIQYNVHRAVANITLTALDTEALAKAPGFHNPLINHKYGADPYAIVYEDRVYIYMTSDAHEFDEQGNIVNNTYGKINKLTVISSSDLVNWTDHGEIAVSGPNGAAKWANLSWAPAIAHKEINGEDKFFLYFSNGAGNIGVLTADSPIGPWSDPLGKALIDHTVPGTQGVVWMFDPAVLVDDDGTGYLYFGGGVPGGQYPTDEQVTHPNTARVVQLGDDMISTVGSAATIDAPYMFENSGIHKYNGMYYYTYCTNFSSVSGERDLPSGEIVYMMSEHPMGPFTVGESIMKNPYYFFEVGGNNHHTIFEFKDQWYITYHAQTLGKAIGHVKGYRSTHINKVEYYSNGKIKPIEANMEGASAVDTLHPYERIEAETMAWQAGLSTAFTSEPGSYVSSVNMKVTDVEDGDWLAVANVDFGEQSPSSFIAKAAASAGGSIEIRLDSLIGPVLGTLAIDEADGEQQWNLYETEVSSVSGVHHIFFIFKGENEQASLFDLDYWLFERDESTEPTPTPSPSPSPKPRPTATSSPNTETPEPTSLVPTPTPTAYVTPQFKDLSGYAWAEEAITYLAEREIVKGTSESTFSPNQNITRADFVTLLIRALNLTSDVKADHSFIDVEEGAYYYEAVRIAKQLGIATGNGNNVFNPKGELTRQDMMVLAARALEIAGKGEFNGDLSLLERFTDHQNISSYATIAISALVRDGIILGNANGTINPKGTATRAESAVILYRLLKAY